MRDHSELKNLPAVLEQASEWGRTPEEVETLVKRIKVRFEWGKTPEAKLAPPQISFIRWILADEHRCPALHYALTEHSHTYAADPRFEGMGYEQWLEFCRVHSVWDNEFRQAWRQWRSSEQRGGIESVN